MNPEKIRVGTIVLNRSGPKKYAFSGPNYSVTIEHRRWNDSIIPEETPWVLTLWPEGYLGGYVEPARTLRSASIRKALRACICRIKADAMALESTKVALSFDDVAA
jgi:hypothetical protein